jgi:hypothetical protein
MDGALCDGGSNRNLRLSALDVQDKRVAIARTNRASAS